ncbi:hypothetical protein GCM10022223_17830 [Kineosporia mesophila]|uniref:PASTA domain-containing protein n=1 Tax=Kineosporia mesophila TaxID=566012 RepID=A0ABP6ZAK1_9ACTN|nr:PASTA domain-containing protein [Kineosporia mesophila]MCD5351980.1 PASTA domain-containing protein [Kineosporia mesophila]
MPTPLRTRLFGLTAAATAVLALSLATSATADAAPAASRGARTTQSAQVQATVIVPNEVGKNVGVAINDLISAGLGLGFREYHDNVCDYAKYQVIQQSPAAGTAVAPGAVVTLTFAVRPAAPWQCP